MTTLTIHGKTHNAKYKLTGQVHYEKLGGDTDHYTAFICSNMDKGQWFHVDDNKVTCARNLLQIHVHATPSQT